VEPQAVPAPQARKKCLLVVDDTIESRLSLAGLLRVVGYTVYEAPDAAQALALLRSSLPVDALVTDVEMPGDMDGVALAHAVRTSWPGIAVVVTSAADYAAAVPDAAVLFLRKPYRPERLLDHLERVLPP
jgi:CheY-like chemotaxis protein